MNAFIINKRYFYNKLLEIKNNFNVSVDVLDTIEAEVQVAQQLARNRCSSVFKARLTTEVDAYKHELEQKNLPLPAQAAIKKLISKMCTQEKRLLQLEDGLVNHLSHAPVQKHGLSSALTGL